MNEAPPADAKPPGYWLTFLTDQWEWDAGLTVDTLEQAQGASREALEALVRRERPELACVTVRQGELKIGVWDWVAGKAYWSRL